MKGAHTDDSLEQAEGIDTRSAGEASAVGGINRPLRLGHRNWLVRVLRPTSNKES
jgi:hypothetical protein